LRNGDSVRRKTIILAMGPWTRPFLARHCGKREFWRKDFFTTSAVSVATIKLTDEEREMPCFKTMPVLAFFNKGITVTLLLIVS